MACSRKTGIGFTVLAVFGLWLDADHVCGFQPIARRQERFAKDHIRHQWRPIRVAPAVKRFHVTLLRLANDEERNEIPTSIAQALDPNGAQARSICLETMQLTEEQYGKARELAILVCDWNEKLNLVSRKDCSPKTVFARHVLPCFAMYNAEPVDDDVPMSTSTENEESTVSSPPATSESLRLFQPKTRVMDVGTGGGFPGLPLAIQYPETQFVLADSVGKKVAAVADMAKSLQLANVRTYHGRVEDYFTTTQEPGSTDPSPKAVRDMDKFDVITGRSVTALPQFCAWIQHLLKPKTGHLVYWIGGEIDPTVLPLALSQTDIEARIPGWKDDSDKKVLIFTASAVRKIAASSGIKVTVTKVKKTRTLASKDGANSKKLPKGAWQKKKEGPRQRGFENFQRYSSNEGMVESRRINDDKTRVE